MIQCTHLRRGFSHSGNPMTFRLYVMTALAVERPIKEVLSKVFEAGFLPKCGIDFGIVLALGDTTNSSDFPGSHLQTRIRHALPVFALLRHTYGCIQMSLSVSSVEDPEVPTFDE